MAGRELATLRPFDVLLRPSSFRMTVRTVWTWTLVAMAASLTLSGCFGGVFVVEASSPFVLTSYGYDGRGGRALEGTLKATLYEGRNEGSIEATYHDAVHAFRVTWVNFTAAFPYQSGGVATDVELFGDSGNGPAAFPRLYAHAAAWGTVEFYVDDVRQPDPISLFQTFDATFFVSQGVYRDNATKRIAGAEGNSTYDPTRPGESSINAIGALGVIAVYTKRGDLYRLIEFRDVEIVAS
jgi:hypothetical protein